jgi:hypothetical protein
MAEQSVSSKEVSLEANAANSERIVPHRNSRHIHDLRIDVNTLPHKMAEFK